MFRKLCLLISFALLAGLVLPGVSEAALKGHWKLDETWGHIACDTSGNNNDGTLGGNVTWEPASGQFDGAASFYVESDFVDCNEDQIEIPFGPNDITGQMTAEQGTVALWFKIRTAQTLRNTWIFGSQNYVGSGNRTHLFKLTSPSVYLRLGELTPQYYSGIYATVDTWYHIAFMWDQNDVDPNDGVYATYKNGALSQNGTYAGLKTLSATANIGNNGDENTDDRNVSFDGLIDDVGMWDEVLGAPAVSNIYSNGISAPISAQATEPVPRNGDWAVPPEPNTWPEPNSLSWKAGSTAVSHDVYFGTDYNDVNDGIGGTSKGNQLVVDCNYDPGILEYGKEYYWRIDAQPGPVKGDVWSFTVDNGKATDPDPGDDDTPSSSDEMAPDGILSWLPGVTADTHKVYLGTNFEDVNVADEGSDEYKGTGTYTCADANRVCFDPGTLTIAVVYYWRVDEVNSVYGTVKGDVWGLKVFSYKTIDDFESYDTGRTDVLNTWTMELKAYWLDIIAGEDDGADDSNQWMEMAFGYPAGEPSYSEAWRIVPDADLTTGGLTKALVLYYMSDDPTSPTYETVDFNEAYVRLEDNSGGDTDTVTLAGPNDVDMDGDWHQWNIDLADFDNPDLDITDINTITLGVGDGTDRGYGIVFFDEIRLYAARCVSSLIDLDGDINNDCRVDFEDIEDMGDDWLDSDYNSIGYDGYLRHTEDAIVGFVAGDDCWVNDPCRGRALEFGGQDTQDYVEIPEYGLCHQPDEPNGFRNRTISMWVKNNDPQTFPMGYPYRARLFQSDYDDGAIEIAIDGGDQRPGHERQLRCTLEDFHYSLHTDNEFIVGEWHHTGMVLNNHYEAGYPGSEGPNLVSVDMYFDGDYAYSPLISGPVHGVWCEDPTHGGEDDVAPRHYEETLDDVHLNGNDDHDNAFIAVTLDEFRIYDHNMPKSDFEKIYLGTDGAVAGDPNILLWYKFDEVSGDIAHDSGRSKDVHIYFPLDTSSNIIEKDPPGEPYDPDNKDIVNFVDYAVLADDWFIQKLWPEP